MQAIAIARYGLPQGLGLRLSERAQPSAAAGEFLIQVHASGVNRPDIFQRLGLYPAPTGIVADIPGLEVAGTIVAGDVHHADNIWRFQHGDAVCALVAGGGYAQYCTAPIAQCLPIPRGLNMIEAASLPETFFTVWSMVFDAGSLGKKGPESVLVHAGSSGIGVTAITLAYALGHRVFTTTRQKHKCEICEDLGAEKAIYVLQEDFVAVIKELTNGLGVDVILDMIAGPYVARDLDCLAEEGRLLLIATLGGRFAQIDAAQIMRRRLQITGGTLRNQSIGFKAKIARSLHQYVWPLFAAKKIQPVVEQVFSAADVSHAHRMMENNQHIGKLVLQWS